MNSRNASVTSEFLNRNGDLMLSKAVRITNLFFCQHALYFKVLRQRKNKHLNNNNNYVTKQQHNNEGLPTCIVH